MLLLLLLLLLWVVVRVACRARIVLAKVAWDCRGRRLTLTQLELVLASHRLLVLLNLLLNLLLLLVVIDRGRVVNLHWLVRRRGRVVVMIRVIWIR